MLLRNVIHWRVLNLNSTVYDHIQNIKFRIYIVFGSSIIWKYKAICKNYDIL